MFRDYCVPLSIICVSFLFHKAVFPWKRRTCCLGDCLLLSSCLSFPFSHRQVCNIIHSCCGDYYDVMCVELLLKLIDLAAGSSKTRRMRTLNLILSCNLSLHPSRPPSHTALQELFLKIILSRAFLRKKCWTYILLCSQAARILSHSALKY